MPDSELIRRWGQRRRMHAQLAKLEPLIEGYRAKLAKVDAEPLPEGKRAGLTYYADLAEKLKTHGLEETEASIANKLARGAFRPYSLWRVWRRWRWRG